MLRELLMIFGSDNPLRAMGDNFAQMLKITYSTTIKAGAVFSGTELTPQERTWIYEQDVEVNKLERKIRQQVMAHLSKPRNSADLPYCVLLMSLVKDVERLGDYAKNLSEIADISLEPLPQDDLLAELLEIRAGVESTFAAVADVIESSDMARAVALTRQGRDISHRCTVLIGRISRSDYDARTVTALVLGTRYYKRLDGHLLNLLSSVTMPLHKVDYYDEESLLADDVADL